eukprot:PhM_4_TR19121/c0_g1_i1/m.66722
MSDDNENDLFVVTEEGDVFDADAETSLQMANDFPDLVAVRPSDFDEFVRQETDTICRYYAEEEEDEEVGEGDDAVDDGEAQEPGIDDHFDQEFVRTLSEFVLEEVVGRRRYKGATYYQCKFHMEPQPSWEPEDDLLDAGHLPKIEAYLNKKRVKPAKKPSTKTRDNVRLIREAYAQVIPSKCFNVIDQQNNNAFLIDRIVSRANESMMTVKDLYFLPYAKAPTTYGSAVVGESPLQRFSAAVNDAKSAHRQPVLEVVFHGTAAANIPSICCRGLLVPNTVSDVKVSNGSAYGVGVYTARVPNISVSYARNTDLMFVVAAHITDSCLRSTNNNILVFDQAQHVCPIALMRFQSQRDTRPKRSVNVYVLDATPSDPNYQLPTKHAVVYTPPLRAFSQSISGNTINIPTAPPSSSPAEGKVQKQFRVLSKRDLRTAPRFVKEQYQAGLIKAPTGKK